MTKSKKRTPKRGSSKPVEAIVGDKRKHAGFVSIENNGKDHLGRILGANGIAWRVA